MLEEEEIDGAIHQNELSTNMSNKLELFVSPLKGTCLRSTSVILPNEFVFFYGCVAQLNDTEVNSNSLLFTRSSMYLKSNNFLDPKWIIDTTEYCSFARFAAHSCIPNCKIVSIKTDNTYVI